MHSLSGERLTFREALIMQVFEKETLNSALNQYVVVRPARWLAKGSWHLDK